MSSGPSKQDIKVPREGSKPSERALDTERSHGRASFPKVLWLSEKEQSVCLEGEKALHSNWGGLKTDPGMGVLTCAPST